MLIGRNGALKLCAGKELIRNPETLQMLEEAGDKNEEEEEMEAKENEEASSDNEEDEKK